MKRATLFLAGAMVLACGTGVMAAPAISAKIKAAVADQGRPAADTARDENRKPAELTAFAGIAPGKVVVDMLPGKESPMHRTNSIDYGIVLEGEIELELDDGARKSIGQGGIIVQRGTNHLWRNTTDQVCRIAFILIEAPAYLHNGEPLLEDKPEGKL